MPTFGSLFAGIDGIDLGLESEAPGEPWPLVELERDERTEKVGMTEEARAARCPGCGIAHPVGTTCREGREAAWAIVKDRDLRDKFPHHYRWARAYLGLDSEKEVSA